MSTDSEDGSKIREQTGPRTPAKADRGKPQGPLQTPAARRSTLQAFGALAVAAACVLGTLISARASGADREAAARPNIVFILSDDHRCDFLGSAGHPFVQTPALDRLARQGVLFSNAFVTTALCSPSRASFLTGQYAHTHGVRNNLTPWRDENVTFLELLKAAGYDTAFIGKWHMPGRLPVLRGVDHFVTFTAQAGQGQYWNCPLIVDGVREPPGKAYITEELTDRALAFIERPRENPFCLFLSHKAVHHEFSPPPDLAQLYDQWQPPLPREADPWVTATRGALWAGTLGDLKTLYRNYCRVVTALDREIGRLLARLDEMALSGNTVVIYAGDNGYFWGEHRLVDKRWAYEEAIRVPFIVRHPGLAPYAGRRAEQMVLNIDLAPTILQLAREPVPESMEGQSFLPFLSSARARGRKAWLYEYFKDFPYNVPQIRAVRTEQHIYIEYEGKRPPEMYDVVADPREHRNLIDTDEGARLRPGLEAMLEALRRGEKL
ncbi:MAG: sulfatase [bacterium]